MSKTKGYTPEPLDPYVKNFILGNLCCGQCVHLPQCQKAINRQTTDAPCKNWRVKGELIRL